MFIKFAQIAWRNIWRNFRRTVITITAIIFGAALMIIFWGWMDGFHSQLIQNSIRIHTGHIQIHKEGYQNNMTVTSYISDPSKLEQLLKSQKGVSFFCQRIKSQGLISTSENSSGVLILGIQPENEANITTIKKSVIKGSYLKDDDKNVILVGEKLAKNLQVDLGDKVVLLVQALDGSMGAGAYRIKGIYRTGIIDFDKMSVQITLASAQELLSYKDKISEIAIITKHYTQIDPLWKELKAKIDPKKYEVLTWKQISPELLQFIELDEISMYITEAIIVFLVVIGVLNTVLMSIFERIREFGVMMALGTKPKQIVGLVIIETLLITIIGLAIGCLLGFLGSYYLATYGLDLSRWSKAMELMSFGSVIYSEIKLSHFLNTILVILTTSLLVSLYPALKAAKLEPVEAIRYI